MTHITLAIDDEQLLKQAMHRATSEGTSLNHLFKQYLERYVQTQGNYQTATAKLLELVKNSNAGSRGRRWTREELYDR